MKQLLKEKHGGYVFSACTVGTVLASLIMALLFVDESGALIQTQGSLYYAYLSTQILFALVLVVFFLKTKVSLQEVGVRICKPKYFVYALLLQFGLLFALGSANEVFVGMLEKLFDYEPSTTPLPSMDGFGYIGVLFAVALIPAICEEMVFRGVMVHSIEKCGMWFCVLVSGVLFSLFHMNPAQTIYQFCCGAVFAFIAYRSGSVFPTMVAHFINNAFVVSVQKFGWEISLTGNVVLTILSAICLIGGLVLLVCERKEERGQGDKKGFLLSCLLGLIICLVFWISGIVV